MTKTNQQPETAFSYVLITSFILLAGLFSCNPGAVPENRIDILTQNMDFQGPDTINAGWNHFRFTNQSGEVHFILLDKLPEGITIEEYREKVFPVFQKGMDLISKDSMDAANATFGTLPEWMPGIVYKGGCGLLSPGQSSDFMLNLDPGYYVMECYVKMANGMFHGGMGMTKKLIVTDSKSETVPDKAQAAISISGKGGIVLKDSLKKGKTLFSVYFEDQEFHENFVGHDVNLVRLPGNYNMETLEKWMNWMDPKGLISPSPEGVVFLGGINDSPAGSTGYFSADLEPGNYALISETPNASSRGMLKTFVIND